MKHFLTIKHILTLTFISFFSANSLPVCAGIGDSIDPNVIEELIDPSDMTKVNTQFATWITSKADIRISGMYTGHWSATSDFAGFVEGNFGNREESDKFGLDYKNGRAQYFQVNELDIDLFPRVGFSLDAIHERAPVDVNDDTMLFPEDSLVSLNPDYTNLDDTMLFSAGLLALVNPDYTSGFMFFPNIAYTVGEVLGESVDGFMLNLFFTKVVGDTGAFFNIWPEYINVSGDNVDMESLKVNVLMAAPVNNNRKTWFQTRLIYGASDVTFNGIEAPTDYDMAMEFGVKWYFN